jgi:hypothetical protein
MHDMFAPVANVMWLVDASSECHTHGNMEFFPTMKKNMEVHYYTMHEGLF